MKRGYRELVGLQATFDKTVSRYSLKHYYRWRSGTSLGPVLSMTGYDMERTQSIESIVDGLRNAYAPVILSIWKFDDEKSEAEYLQFHVNAQPADLHFDDGWSIWAQW